MFIQKLAVSITALTTTYSGRVNGTLAGMVIDRGTIGSTAIITIKTKDSLQPILTSLTFPSTWAVIYPRAAIVNASNASTGTLVWTEIPIGDERVQFTCAKSSAGNTGTGTVYLFIRGTGSTL